MGAVISYILSLIATVLGLIEPFNKKMQMVLVFNFLGNLLVGTSYILAGGLDGGAVSGAAICYVACIQVFINYYFTAKGKKRSLVGYNYARCGIFNA